MHILYWVELYSPHIGGIETFSEDLISVLRAKGHQFSIVTCASELAGAQQESTNGIKIYRFPFHRAILNKDLKEIHQLSSQVAQLIRDLNQDLVHINSSQPSIFFYSLAQEELNLPTLFTVHGLPPRGCNKNSLVGRSMLNADWVTANSKSTLQIIRSLLPEISSRSSLIYYGIRAPMLPTSEISFDPPKLLCLGRLVEEKGFDIAIQAFSEVQKVFPNAKLIIAGDGIVRGELERQVEYLGLAQSVEFKGWCQADSVTHLIDDSTMMIVPSRYQEPFGLVALEAGQRARPVVAARVGGLAEVVLHNENGLLFESENVNELTQQIILLLKHPEMAETLGRAGFRRSHQLFSMEKAANAYEAIYQSLIGESDKKTGELS